MEEKKTYRRRHRHRYFTGEDIDMLHEREQDRKRERSNNVCDTNIDGA